MKRNILTIAAFVTVILAAYYLLAVQLNVDRAWVLVALLSIVLVWGAVKRLLPQLKKFKLDKKSIKAQANQPQSNASNKKLKDIEEIQQQLAARIHELKKLKISSSISKMISPHALPWYLIMGTSNSDKMTTLKNSKLTFLEPNFKFEELMESESCVCVPSMEGAFFNTSERYIEGGDDVDAEWKAVLTVLKKYRKRNTIYGLILNVNIQDIVAREETELQALAVKIRHRIDEIIEYLHVRFPVYVVFTKCDLIEGFSEFFSSFTTVEEREQIWGATLNNKNRLSKRQKLITYEDNLHLAGNFENEFELLVGRLKQIRLGMLNQDIGLGYRKLIYSFPEEFAEFKNKLVDFLNELFRLKPLKENPTPRGFYFTSDYHGNTKPHGKAVGAILSEFNITPKKISRFISLNEQKSHFIRDLFTKVILPDRNLVSSTFSRAQFDKFIRIATISLSIIFLILMTVKLSSSSQQSKGRLNHLQHNASALKDVNWDNPQLIVRSFELLRNFRSSMAPYRNEPFYALMGLGKREVVFSVSEKLYLSKIEGMGKYFCSEVEDQLRNIDNFSTEEVYDMLEVYLVLNHKLALSNDRKILLKRKLPSFIDRSWESRRTQTKSPYQEEIDQYVEQILVSNNYDCYDGELVEKARMKFNRTPTLEDIYQKLKKGGRGKTDAYTIEDLVELRNLDILTSANDYKVDGIFTKVGWNGYMKKAIQETIQKPPVADSVIGITQAELPEELRDPNTLARKLMETYLADYAMSWQRFLGSIEYKSEAFNSFTSAVDDLERIGNPHESPIRKLFNNVFEQTSIFEDVDSTLRLISQSSTIENPLTKFKYWQQIGKSGEDGLPSQMLSDILNQYIIIADYVGKYKDSPESTTDEVVNILKQKTGSLPDVLSEISGFVRQYNLTEQKYIFETPISQTWKFLLGQATIYLNNLWDENVRRYYNKNLAENYPFSVSRNDVDISHMEELFNPKTGKLWVFYENQITPFLNRRGKPEKWFEQGIELSRKADSFFAKAENIKKELFSEGALKLEFTLEPLVLQTRNINVEKVCLTIDDQSYCIRPGLENPYTFIWPGTKLNGMTSLEIFSSRTDVEPIKFNGRWGWFRLLEKCRATRTSSRSFQVEWKFTQSGLYDAPIRYELTTPNSDNLVFQNTREFFTLECPDQLTR